MAAPPRPYPRPGYVVTDPKAPNTLLCVPVDATSLTAIPGVEIPARSFEQGDTQTACPACERPVWLGGMQRAYLQLHPDAPVICYFCLVAMMEIEMQRTGTLPGLNIRSLDPTR